MNDLKKAPNTIDLRGILFFYAPVTYMSTSEKKYSEKNEKLQHEIFFMLNKKIYSNTNIIQASLYLVHEST